MKRSRSAVRAPERQIDNSQRDAGTPNCAADIEARKHRNSNDRLESLSYPGEDSERWTIAITSSGVSRVPVRGEPMIVPCAGPPHPGSRAFSSSNR